MDYLDFEVEKAAGFIGSSWRLQVELGTASGFGKLRRFQNIVMVNADKSLLEGNDKQGSLLERQTFNSTSSAVKRFDLMGQLQVEQ